jgi:glucokinase
LNNDKYSIGIDLGGTSVRIGLFAKDMTQTECISIPTRRVDGPEAVILDMRNALWDLERRHAVSVEAVGLGSPGPLDLVHGRLCTLPNFPGWDDFPLKLAAEAAFEKRVLLENDANAAALAEWYTGVREGVGVSSLCMVTLGTGVGNGIILDGRIWHGSFGVGGEMGHTCVEPEGDPCPCGGRGCLEYYASATGISRSAAKRGLLTDGGEELSAREVATLAHSGNAVARELFEQVGIYLGRAIAGAANILDLPLYVIGGGVVHSWDLFAPKMMGVIEHLSYTYRLRLERARSGNSEAAVAIVPSRCGSSAGLIGAALLPRMELTDSRGLS